MRIIELQRDLVKGEEIGSWVLHIIRNQAFMKILDDFDITSLIISKELNDMMYQLSDHFKFTVEVKHNMLYTNNIEAEGCFDFIFITDKGDFRYIVNRDISKERDDYINDILNS